jgi:hypothetical protein
MLHILWRFRAKPARVPEFRRTYGSDGDWAKLFRLDSDYCGTALIQEVRDPLSFVVMDRWVSSESFGRFREQFSDLYERLDEQCRELTEEEALIGYFTDEYE